MLNPSPQRWFFYTYMSKESYYFSHDYNARNDEKILELRHCYGAEGYGIFWMIVETMAENENGGVNATLLGGLSLGFGVYKDKLKLIVDCCLKVGLFHEKDGYYFSNRLLKYKQHRKNQSEFGKEGAAKRWGSHRHPNGVGNATPNAKERKVKEIKGIAFSEDFAEVIFPDGKTQPLGEIQKLELGRKNLRPQSVIWGKIE